MDEVRHSDPAAKIVLMQEHPGAKKPLDSFILAQLDTRKGVTGSITVVLPFGQTT